MNEAVSQVDHWRQGLSHTQSKALSLLGKGISSVMVASTLGVSESLISQFLADGRFAEEVTKLKLATLQKQTSIDDKYMESEEKLVDKLLKVIPLMTKPMDILRGIQTINATKRRGMAEVTGTSGQSTIVNINLPQVMAARFISNGHNQIVEIQDEQGTRSLITSTVSEVSKFAAAQRIPESFTGDSGDANSSTANLLAQASKRVAESGVSETIPEGLRKRLEAKSSITADDI